MEDKFLRLAFDPEAGERGDRAKGKQMERPLRGGMAWTLGGWEEGLCGWCARKAGRLVWWRLGIPRASKGK